ncbi:MAG: hypothetical protein GTO45_25010 [Candidatus Aminicenantes bacterium]|nr:hypothetical protein [Candidatus Aminicenantes bacterium]NIN21392.1 hypothetical protein [Candidatus Aminicenantes bacterium]NIN45213.1 hypothetical protein [Candidatus Aminicenantes bacterium]NIN88030.1 hypothetical protein [Candidatus Aminicenantes bacterium]NIO84344.1 hypothetical protein [Candidatus Aminicenantes bacterium]
MKFPPSSTDKKMRQHSSDMALKPENRFPFFSTGLQMASNSFRIEDDSLTDAKAFQ